jgi:hypothetical protein
MGLGQTRTRSRRDGELWKLLVAVLLTGLTLLGGGVGVYFWATATRPPARDQTTFCPMDGWKAVTVMLLDTSDPLPKSTRDEVTKRLTDIADDLPEYALLEVRVLDPAFAAGRVVFSLCNPGDGRGLNEFTGNPSLAKRRWRERFREPLDRALDSGLQPQRSETSPILAAMQGIAIDRFTGKAAGQMPKALVIVSDMIENGKDYSQYRGDLTYQRFKTTPAYPKFRTDLNGATVQILYVQRLIARPLDSGVHIRFWIDWIQDNGGQLSKAIKLQGVGQS